MELGGPSFIVGNHVTIRSDDGVFAVSVHLKNGSASVKVGDRVCAGREIAECGNSGSSSEPHVHAQLMDRRSFWTGQGVAFSFKDVRIGEAEEPQNTLPANQQHVTIDLQVAAPVQRAKTRKTKPWGSVSLIFGASIASVAWICFPPRSRRKCSQCELTNLY